MYNLVSIIILKKIDLWSNWQHWNWYSYSYHQLVSSGQAKTLQPCSTQPWIYPQRLSHKVHHWATIIWFVSTIWFLQNLSSGTNKVYKYVQRRQMSDVCLELTDDINLWQRIERVLVQDAKWTMGGFKQVQFVQHLLNVPTLSCYTSSECSKCWTKVESFLQERERTNAVHCNCMPMKTERGQGRHFLRVSTKSVQPCCGPL